jgi:lysophospholipase-2
MSLLTVPTPLRLRTHTIKSLGTHTHTIIFLHGRGSDATEFALELFESHASATKLSLRDTFPSFKWVFPYAPSSVPSNRNASDGFAMPQWFDIWSVADPQDKRENQRVSLSRGVEALVNLMKKEIRDGGVSSEHIFLAGISQGIALAVHAVFQLDTPLAGLLGFCGWIPFEQEVRSIASSDKWDGTLDEIRAITSTGQQTRSSESQLETLVYLSHSQDDWVVPIKNGRDLKDCLEVLGMKVEWHEYPNGAHWFQEPEGIDDLAAFLRKSMAKHYLIDRRLSRPAQPLELIILDDEV